MNLFEHRTSEHRFKGYSKPFIGMLAACWWTLVNPFRKSRKKKSRDKGMNQRKPEVVAPAFNFIGNRHNQVRLAPDIQAVHAGIFKLKCSWHSARAGACVGTVALKPSSSICFTQAHGFLSTWPCGKQAAKPGADNTACMAFAGRNAGTAANAGSSINTFHRHRLLINQDIVRGLVLLVLTETNRRRHNAVKRRAVNGSDSLITYGRLLLPHNGIIFKAAQCSW